MKRSLRSVIQVFPAGRNDDHDLPRILAEKPTALGYLETLPRYLAAAATHLTEPAMQQAPAEILPALERNLMLSTLENHLLTALRQVHPADLAIRAGPPLPPATTDKQLLTVTALSLQLPPLDLGQENSARREPAFLMQRVELAADGVQQDFNLPAAATGKLVAVESPPGRIARPGDDYRLEEKENTLKFYRAPTQTVVIQLRGERTRGYQETLPCRIVIELAAWAESAQQADNIVVPSIAAALSGFIDRDVLDLAQDDRAGLRVRLYQPTLGLDSIERGVEAIAQAHYRRSRARLLLRGELELTLALGAPPPTAVIRHIAIHQDQQ